MAKVQIVNVEVLDNPSPFFNPFQFQITFDCIENLSDDLEWKIIYVGSAESDEYDQELDSVLVGPVPAGRHRFVFQADPPKPELIPVQDAVGVTVVIITCTYHTREFIRVGYFVNNEYNDPDMRENPPEIPNFPKLMRNILDSKPRVTRFKINWDDNAENGAVDEETPPSPQTNFGSSIEEVHSGCEGTFGVDQGHLNNSNNGLSSMSDHQEKLSKGQIYENSTDSMDMRMFVE
ncbi:histone chaperone ASF1-like [Styela clava]|uniref:histone chaperone ASF1-like n=1 Tax=Styela clava TaxID=7725 RepID=UPI00193AC74B|nr:histone chaperone ASF1-like [Styela clava]